MPTISDQDMRAAVAKAILETLDQNKRDLLVQSALENLIAPRKDEKSYGKERPSILQVAFFNELELLSREVVHSYFTQGSPMREKLHAFVQKMVEEMLTDESGELGHAFADAISGGSGRS